MSNDEAVKRLKLDDRAGLLDRNILAARLVRVPKMEGETSRAVRSVKHGEDVFFFDFLDTLERQSKVGHRVDGVIVLLLVLGDMVFKGDRATAPVFQVDSRCRSLNSFLLPIGACGDRGDALLHDKNRIAICGIFHSVPQARKVGFNEHLSSSSGFGTISKGTAPDSGTKVN